MANKINRRKTARAAMPILVRLTETDDTISYSGLGKKIGLYQRNLNKTLDCMGKMLNNLSASPEWKHPRIPGLGTIVIYASGAPPTLKSVKPFVAKENRSNEAGVLREQQAVFDYEHWDEVLEKLDLSSVSVSIEYGDYPGTISEGAPRGGGESPDHKELKNDVAVNPGRYGIEGFSSGKIERPLPSGDFLDVFFKNNRRILGVEVKSRRSGKADIRRGIYQCVKYKAVLEARQRVRRGARKSIRTLLVVGKKMPREMDELAHTLGVEWVTAPRRRRTKSTKK